MRFSESNEAFEQRQKRYHDSFLEFKANLTEKKARIILDHLQLDEFSALVEAAEEFADRWYKLFMSIEEARLPAVHNLVLLLAQALGRKDPNKAKELFLRVKDSKPFVRYTFGRSGVQFEAMAIWAGLPNSVRDTLRFARLDRANNDHDLSNEVLAALLNGQQQLLKNYVEKKLLKEEPAEISRGIMVDGFSDQNKFNDEVLNKYEGYAGYAGLIGIAQKAAKYAYERNVWGRYWFKMMCQANENTDFWRYSILFSKIVDARLTVWRSSYVQAGKSIQSFGHTLDDRIGNRFKQWENHRKKKLFGSDAPPSIFLESLDTTGTESNLNYQHS